MKACVGLSVLSEHIEHTFKKYRDNTENRDNFVHDNREVKFSYRYIPNGGFARRTPGAV